MTGTGLSGPAERNDRAAAPRRKSSGRARRLGSRTRSRAAAPPLLCLSSSS